MRTPVIAGNWKMNCTIESAVELVRGIFYGLRWPDNVEVIVAPPFTAIHDVADVLKESYIGVAAQNIHWEDSGAFTGEISGHFAKNAGADYAIIGHSERRQFFGETDETVNKKIGAAIKNDLIPVVCIGETLDEREENRVTEVISAQAINGLAGFSENEVAGMILAYEPVWAIGTGKSASPEQAEEVHSIIRGLILQNFGPSAADRVRILYGGSVKPENSGKLLSLPNIDGALVGGASLKVHDFIEIIKSAV